MLDAKVWCIVDRLFRVPMDPWVRSGHVSPVRPNAPLSPHSRALAYAQPTPPHISPTPQSLVSSSSPRPRTPARQLPACRSSVPPCQRPLSPPLPRTLALFAPQRTIDCQLQKPAQSSPIAPTVTSRLPAIPPVAHCPPLPTHRAPEHLPSFTYRSPRARMSRHAAHTTTRLPMARWLLVPARHLTDCHAPPHLSPCTDWSTTRLRLHTRPILLRLHRTLTPPSLTCDVGPAR